MADDWDDDDFGTFESADVGSPVGSTVSSTSSSAPAWLLTAQTPQTQISSTQRETKDIVNLIETPVKSHNPENVSQNTFKENNSENHATEGNLDLTEKSQKQEDEVVSDGAPPTSQHSAANLEDAFSDIFGGDSLAKSETEVDATPIPNSARHPESTDTISTGKTVELLPVEEPKIQTDGKIVAELQGKLDNALILKKQSEKTVTELREELKITVDELQAEIQARDDAHRQEVAKLDQQKREELKQTNDDAQQAMKLLTGQYTELCERIAKEQQLQFEKQLTEVTQKCVKLLELQHSSMDERIKEEVAKRSSKVDEMLEDCKRDITAFVTSQCDEVVERCGQASETVETHLKDKITEEFEAQRKTDLTLKAEAIEELTKLHKAEVEHLMAEERLKSSEAIKHAVDDARKTVRAAISEEQEKSNRARDRHLLALKMLLTSSQEHLNQLVSETNT